MALIPTEQLIDEFFKSTGNEVNSKIYSQVSRPDLYKYEIEIGKQLVDMNKEELFGLLDSFTDLKHRTVLQIVHFYRGIIDYYSFNYEPVINHFHSKDFKGLTLTKRITDDRKKFSLKDIDDAISAINAVYMDQQDKINYLECIINLFFDGFMHAEEVVLLKESDINFETNEVIVSGRKIVLSNRTMYLLKYVHNMQELGSYRTTYVMTSWGGGYFKYPVRESNLDNFLQQDISIASAAVSRKFVYDINIKCKQHISPISVYYLGLYHRFVEKCGSEEKAKEIVYSGHSMYLDEINEFIKENNLVVVKASYLKMYFREFV